MVKINKEQVEDIAKLARLDLGEAEKEKFTKQLGSVLEYFSKLDAADTSNVSAIEQINQMENVVRDDEIIEKWLREELLKNAPEQEEGFLKVKAVF